MPKKSKFILCILAAFMMKEATIVLASSDSSSIKSTLSNENNEIAPSKEQPLKGKKNDFTSKNITKDPLNPLNITKRVNHLFSNPRITPLPPMSPTNIKIDLINSSSASEKNESNRKIPPLDTNTLESTVKINLNGENKPQYKKNRITLPPLSNAPRSAIQTCSPDSVLETKNILEELDNIKTRFFKNLCNIALKNPSKPIPPAQLEKELERNKTNTTDLLTYINRSLPIKDEYQENAEIEKMCRHITQWQQQQNREYPSFPSSTLLKTLAHLCNVNVEYAQNVEHTHLPPKLDSIFLDPPKEANKLVLDQILAKTILLIDNEQYLQAISKLNQIVYFFKPFTTIDIIIINSEKLDIRIQGSLLDFTPLGEKTYPYEKGTAFGSDHKIIPQFILSQMEILLSGVKQYLRKAETLMDALLAKVPYSPQKNEITPLKECLTKQHQGWKEMSPILSKIYLRKISAID